MVTIRLKKSPCSKFGGDSELGTQQQGAHTGRRSALLVIPIEFSKPMPDPLLAAQDISPSKRCDVPV